MTEKAEPFAPTPPEPTPPLSVAVARSWHVFLERCEPLRPELYRYCRYLTRSPWDADDLVQDALARAFVTLGCVHQEIASPRAWLLRVASNLWLNRVRAARELPVESPEAALAAVDADPPADPRAAREAAGALIVRLAPQERAAVVLKDVFDLSLEEIAEALSTTVGAVNAALHRGRGKRVDPESFPGAAPVPAVLDAFCDAFFPEGQRSPDVLVRIASGGAGEENVVWWLGDLFSNTTAADASWPLRPLARLAGSGLGYRRNTKPGLVYVEDREAWLGSVAAAVRERPPTVVVPAHGDPVVEDAAERTAALMGESGA